MADRDVEVGWPVLAAGSREATRFDSSQDSVCVNVGELRG